MKEPKSVEMEAKERGGVVMNDHLYQLNQWSNQAVLKAITTEQSLKENQVGAGLDTKLHRSEVSARPSQTENELPSSQDPVRAALQARQKQLQSQGSSEVLIQQARADLMKDARAEFAAVMQQLNGQMVNAPQAEQKKPTAVLADAAADRMEQAAKADQPAPPRECPLDLYQQKLSQNDAATIIAGEPH